LDQIDEQLPYLREALARTPTAPLTLHGQLDKVAREVARLREQLSGHPVRARLSEFDRPSAASRLYHAAGSLFTRLAPTATQRRSLELGRSNLEAVEHGIERLQQDALTALEDTLAEAGAPWTP
ncbi:MAG: hypothetical protein AAFX85_14250, partial [Pseudomonadota bacterium]